MGVLGHDPLDLNSLLAPHDDWEMQLADHLVEYFEQRSDLPVESRAHHLPMTVLPLVSVANAAFTLVTGPRVAAATRQEVLDRWYDVETLWVSASEGGTVTARFAAWALLLTVHVAFAHEMCQLHESALRPDERQRLMELLPDLKSEAAGSALERAGVAVVELHEYLWLFLRAKGLAG